MYYSLFLLDFRTSTELHKGKLLVCCDACNF